MSGYYPPQRQESPKFIVEISNVNVLIIVNHIISKSLIKSYVYRMTVPLITDTGTIRIVGEMVN